MMNTQHKTDLIRKQAKATVTMPELKLRASDNSLSKSIRNKKEADVFLAALNAVIQIARERMNNERL